METTPLAASSVVTAEGRASTLIVLASKSTSTILASPVRSEPSDSLTKDTLMFSEPPQIPGAHSEASIVITLPEAESILANPD